MEHRMNFYDKFNKFRLIHHRIVKLVSIVLKIVLVVMALIMIVVVLSTQFKKLLSNSGFIVVLASILGATVGGIITYIINTRSILLSNRMKSSIINKKVIYEPLIMEYKNILERLLKENKTLYFCCDSKYKAIGSTSYEVWKRIQSDTRIYQMPDFYKKECIIVDGKISKYIESETDIINKVYEIFESLLNYRDYKIEENEHGIKSLIDAEVDNLIIGNNIIIETLFKEKIVGLPTVRDEDREYILSCFEPRFNDSRVIDLFNESKKELIASLKGVIDTTEAIIVRIATTYERRNNIF